jgi:transposase
MKNKRRLYTQEFKDESCKLVTAEGDDPKTAAERLGIPEMTLRFWLKQRGWRGPQSTLDEPVSDDPAALKVQVRDLQARLRRAEMEREILKKATAFFANQSP